MSKVTEISEGFMQKVTEPNSGVLQGPETFYLEELHGQIFVSCLEVWN